MILYTFNGTAKSMIYGSNSPVW